MRVIGSTRDRDGRDGREGQEGLEGQEGMSNGGKLAIGVTATLMIVVCSSVADAHGVSGKDALFLQSIKGAAIGPLMYLGAKHMVTGYDHLAVPGRRHLLSLPDEGHRPVRQPVHDRPQPHAARRRARRHSRQPVHHRRHHRVLGRLQGLRQHGRLQRFFGFQPNTRVAVLVFGLFHGFGLATKLQEFALSPNGLVANIVSFNVGVEIGQVSR